MRAVVQRVSKSSVCVDGKIIGEISNGFNVLLGICNDDTIEDSIYLAKKIINLRVFDDEEGTTNKCIKDVGGEILVISQFTLFGDVRKGNRPSFIHALRGEEANKLYEIFVSEIKKEINVYTGKFGANMEVNIVNDGPVTILIDSKKLF